MGRLFKRLATGLALLLALWGIVLAFFDFDFGMSVEEARAWFQKRKITPRFHETVRGERPLHYVCTGDEQRPLVVFVHGSPGSWDAFKHFLVNGKLLAHAHLASIDRPGFGKSGAGKHEPSMAEQAADLAEIIREHAKGKGAILVGHSLGGPVIARMAMDFPELVKGLVLVAPSIDPDLEQTKWYQIPAEWPLLRRLIPMTLKVTNREILPLKQELTQMLPLWGKVSVPVTVIQGGADKLVPSGNADFAERMLQHNHPHLVRVPDMNHFVPWNHPQLIEAAVLDHLSRLNRAP